MALSDKEKSMVRYHAAKVFHNHAVQYDDWFADNLEYKIELTALRSLQTERVGPKIEIGVGPGRFAKDLGIGFGLDPAWRPLGFARQRGISCCQGVGEELPLKDNVIGAVYLLFTLCFGLNPQKIMTECARVLKNRGHIIIGTVPAASGWGRYLAAKKEAGHIFYEHASFLSIQTIRQWLTAANMRIIEYRSTLYQPPGGVEQIERPVNILDEQAGFAVVVARKEKCLKLSP